MDRFLLPGADRPGGLVFWGDTAAPKKAALSCPPLCLMVTHAQAMACLILLVPLSHPAQSPPLSSMLPAD